MHRSRLRIARESDEVRTEIVKDPSESQVELSKGMDRELGVSSLYVCDRTFSQLRLCLTSSTTDCQTNQIHQNEGCSFLLLGRLCRCLLPSESFTETCCSSLSIARKNPDTDSTFDFSLVGGIPSGSPFCRCRRQCCFRSSNCQRRCWRISTILCFRCYRRRYFLL